MDENLQILQDEKFFEKQIMARVDNSQQNRLGEAGVTAHSLKNNLDLQDGLLGRKRPLSAVDELTIDPNEPQPPVKVWKGLRYKTWSSGAMQPAVKHKKPNEREVTEVCSKFRIYRLRV